MDKEHLIKQVDKKSQFKRLKKWLFNRYFITIFLFLIWMIFFDSSSLLVLKELDDEIQTYEDKLEFYKSEYEKNDQIYKKLMNNKDEREKFARENYFMKKRDEEIFILVVDSLHSKP